MLGITRVSDQYGHLAEAEAHREQLASIREQAAAIAASQRGHRITPGMNDPRRLQHLTSGYDDGSPQDWEGDWGKKEHDEVEQLGLTEEDVLAELMGVPPPPPDPRHAAKGDFGGKKAPPFGSKPDDDEDDDKGDKPWHEAGYGYDDIDRANHRRRLYGPDDVPADELSAQSGYDPEGDWQDHRRTPIGPHVVGAMEPRLQLEDPHDDWDDGFGGWQTNMDDGTWSSDRLSDELGDEPRHRHEDLGFSSDDVDRLKAGPEDSKGGYGGWESGLDRPFTGATGPDFEPDPLTDPSVADPMYGGDPSYHDPVT